MKLSPLEKVCRAELLCEEKRLFDRMGDAELQRGLMRCSEVAWSEWPSVDLCADGYVRLSGMAHCRLSYCVACSYPRQVDRREQLREGIYRARKRGWGVYLLTSTFSHDSADFLDMIQWRFGKARQILARNGSFRRWIRDLDYHGRITDYEVQVGGSHGYHPHSHDLLMLAPDLDLESLQAEYCRYWLKALRFAGLDGLEKYACRIDGYKGVGDYLSKMSAEMSLHLWTKESWGGGSMSPFQCLKTAVDAHNDYLGSLFCEYCRCVKGKRMLGWSRGLKRMLGLDDAAASPEQNDGRKPMIVLRDRQDAARLSAAEWKILLETLNKGDLDLALYALRERKVSYCLDPETLSEYEQKKESL